jgi:signal transduction histidine kinase
MPQGGDLTLRTALRQQPGADGGQLIEVEIEDTGGGIPEQIREKIFSPFYTTRTQGTGLGLSITRKILEQSGGQVSFQSAPGKGTTFRVVIPVIESRTPV